MAQPAFDAAMAAYMAQLPISVTQMNALGAYIDAQATAAAGSASSATTSASIASAAAQAAATSANAAPWVSGFAYAAYASAISLVDFQTYRAMTAVTSATDPANDPTHWVNVTGTHRTVLLTTSQSWSPPYPVVATVTVTGGGGSAGSGSTTNDGSASGSGGGTTIKYNLLLLPSVSYAAVIGAPGAAATAGGTGNDGTASTFSGSGIPTLTGGAGLAGPRVLNGNTANSANIPRGGQGSGGDVSIEGGPGDILYATVTPIGTVVTGNAANIVPCPGGSSYWGPGSPVGITPTNYGAGGPGVKSAVVSLPGKQGVIKIEWN